MEKLQELKKKYKELGEEIERLEKKGDVWKPQHNEKYFFIKTHGEIDWTYWKDDNYFDTERYEIGNCFKTREKAEKAVEKAKIYTQLKRLAEEINTEPIDWENEYQIKYAITYDYDKSKITQTNWTFVQAMNVIYCTNKNFLDIALERIGEENLLKLFKEE